MPRLWSSLTKVCSPISGDSGSVILATTVKILEHYGLIIAKDDKNPLVASSTECRESGTFIPAPEFYQNWEQGRTSGARTFTLDPDVYLSSPELG